MPSFFVTTATSAGQSLFLSEVGIVARNGSINAPGTGITASGTTQLTVSGSVYASKGIAVLLNAPTSFGLHVGAAGEILENQDGTEAIGGTFGTITRINNAGTIAGVKAIALTSTTASALFNLTNSGTIDAFGPTGAAAIRLTMPGTGTVSINNAGSILAAGAPAIVITAGKLNLTNSGVIGTSDGVSAAVDAGGELRLLNSGAILGGVKATSTTRIGNSGTIEGDILLNAGNDVVFNAGTVNGSVQLGNGSNDFTNAGGRVSGFVVGGSGNDIYRVDRSDINILDGTGGLDGVFSTANFRLAFGIEQLILKGPNALVGIGNGSDNLIHGDVGDDVLRGLVGNDTLDGLDGTNALYGGDGDDSLFSGGEDDVAFGGVGNDKVVVEGSFRTLQGGLGNDTVDFQNEPGAMVVNLATGEATAEGTDGLLIVRGFENLSGSSFDDVITGTAGANKLEGRFGNDTILAGGGDDEVSGGAGNDRLTGGAGADGLAGGLGADVLTGSAGADSFLYIFVGESTAASRDIITDFTQGSDRVDLHLIDADSASVPDDAFVFVGSADFAGTGPQIRATVDIGAGTTLIEVRLNGSVSDDMQILLGTAVTLTAADFIL